MKNIKQKLAIGYIALGIIYMLCSWRHVNDIFLVEVALNLGRGTSWPAHMFPAIGHVTGGFIWLLIFIVSVYFSGIKIGKNAIALIILVLLLAYGISFIFHKPTEFENQFMKTCPDGMQPICKCTLNKLEQKYSQDELIQEMQQPSQALELDTMTATNDCKNGD